MLEDEWPNFIKSILTGCTFECVLTCAGNRKGFDICPFDARYYDSKEGIRHFHITNDTRRKIKRFLIELYNNKVTEWCSKKSQ